MNHELFIRPEAEAELTEAHAWYEKRVRGLGGDFLLCAEAIFHAITRSPQQYPLIFKETRRAILHRFPYAIFFVVDDRRVTVLAVFHAKRDPKQLLKRS